MPRLPDHIPFTMIPNFIIDKILESCTEGEIKILLTIYRKTVGYDKKYDKISYSQFIENTGLSRSTISEGIKGLEIKKQIKVNRSGTINRYTYCLPSSNAPIADSSNIKLELVQNSNYPPVRKSNTQKKPIKENKKNTTNSSSDLTDEVREIIKYWNEIFPNTLKHPNSDLKRHIENAVSQLSMKEVKEAIFRRSNCNYYIKKKPQLIDKPSAFFPYPETIKNDLNRKTDTVFTYDERNERIFNKQNTDDDFEIIWDKKDNQGRPLWKLKDASCMITVSNI